VLLFGANKIPKLARSTGEAMGEFQKGRQEVEKELEEMQDTTSVDAENSDAEDSLNLDSEESSGGSSSS
jgi:sec-independent protein translocase protein TatA